MNEKLQKYSETMDTTLGEVSNTAVLKVMQTLSDCLEYTSKLKESNDSIYTELYPKLEEMQNQMNFLSLFIAEIIANGSQSLISMISSESTQTQACPTYYQKQGFKSIQFIDRVLDDITSKYNLTPVQIYSIKDFLKYTIRVGEKDPWWKDADKAADYIVRCITNGIFLNEIPGKELMSDDEG